MTIRAGISIPRLQRWDAHVQQTYLDSGLLPNAQTLVYRRGELAYQSVLGFADIGARTPLREDHLFRIYSMTKPLTSLACLMLVEEGRLSLKDPVSAFIPAWTGLGVHAGDAPPTAPHRPVQVVDLLRHTAGLSYHIQQGTATDALYRQRKLGFGTTLADFVAGIAELPLEYSPGEAWLYSAATDVLGYVVQQVAGVPFEQFLKERILTPLDMHDTDLQVPPEKAERLTTCYALTPQGQKVFDPAQGSRFLNPPLFVSGGGGLVGTAADYLRFCRCLLRGGELDGARLIGPKTLHLMVQNHLPGGADIASLSRSVIGGGDAAGVGFGLGFAVTIDPARTLLPGSRGDFFWGGAAGSYFWVDPAEDLAVVFMTQTLNSPEQARHTLRTMVYAALEDSATDWPTRA